MRNITKDELNEILRKHNLWIIGSPDGEMANLSEANLFITRQEAVDY